MNTVKDYFLNYFVPTQHLNEYSAILFPILAFIFIGFIILKKNPIIFQNDKADTKKLARNALIIFFITLLATRNYPTPNYGIILLKNILSIIISLLPIYWSFCQCQTYWTKMNQELDEGNYNDNIYPTLMVTQGTFYTFVGVASILFSYNASGYHQDISIIIGGLKLAFITSVIGMVYSIAAKNHLKSAIKDYLTTKKQYDKIPKILTETDFYLLALTIKEELTTTKNCLLHLPDFHDKLLKQHEETMRTSRQQISEVLQNVSQKISQNIESAFSQMAEKTASINENLQNTPQYILNINSSLHSMYEETSQLLPKITEVLENYREITENINKSAIFLQQSSDLLANYANSLDKYDPLTTTKEIHETLIKLSEELQTQTNNLTSLFRDSQNEILSTEKDTIQTITRTIQELQSTSTKSTATMIAQLSEHMNGYMEALKSQSNDLAEYTQNLKNVSAEINSQPAIIHRGQEGIVKAFDILSANLTQKNMTYNDQLLESQKRYHEMMETSLSEIMTAIGEIIKVAKEKYMTDIQTIYKNIDSLSSSKETATTSTVTTNSENPLPSATATINSPVDTACNPNLTNTADLNSDTPQAAALSGTQAEDESEIMEHIFNDLYEKGGDN